ncbi:MAG: prepilin-type N-terminal cleavage/methylation domain-containing protein [Acidimicrobiia bacterium]
MGESDERDEGFTLAELMIVVLVLAILIAAAFPAYTGARVRAADGAAKANLRTSLDVAQVEAVSSSTGTYPDSASMTSAENSLTFVDSSTESTNSSTVSVEGGSSYVAAIKSQSGTCWAVSMAVSAQPVWSTYEGEVCSAAAVAGSAYSYTTVSTFASLPFVPFGVVVDSSGNVFVADALGSRIKKITPAGVSTFAGSGSCAETNGTGTAAAFCYPFGLAIDSSDNIYVADQYSNAIRKVTPAGVVTSLISEAPYGYQDGSGASIQMTYPMSIAVDNNSGNVYFTEMDTPVVRKLTPAGVVSTLAGNASSWGSANGTGTSATFGGSMHLAVDSSGNVIVSDQYNHMIRKITPAGVVTTIAGTTSAGSTDGTGTNARFNNPFGVAVDSNDNLFVADYSNRIVRKISSAGVVTTLAGTGLAGTTDGPVASATFTNPYYVAIDPSSSAILLGDVTATNIRKIS